MKISEKINDELKKSLLNKNKEKTIFLRTIKGELDRIGRKVEDDKVISVLKGMLDNAQQLNNKFEIDILNSLLPKMLSNEEIKKEIDKIIEENNFSTMKDLGSLMKIMKEKHGSKFDGKIASSYGKDKLGFNAIKRK